MEDIFSFERLTVYQESVDLVDKVYRLSYKFPKTEQYALSSQIQRAVVSVTSNIAEGSGRFSIKEKCHFLEIAFGSLLEVYCQLQIAVRLNYIDEADFNHVKPKFFSVSRLINGLRQSYKEKL